MKKRYSEAQIIEFLQKADAGLPLNQLYRLYGFFVASDDLWRNKRFDPCLNEHELVSLAHGCSGYFFIWLYNGALLLHAFYVFAQ